MNESDHTQTACIIMTECTAGEFMLSDGWIDVDRVCQTCPVETFQSLATHVQESCTDKLICPPGSYEIDPGTLSTDRMCEECTLLSTDSACISVSDCVPGQYVSEQFTSTTDRVCTGCDNGTFSIAVNADVCAAVATCAAGQFVERNFTTSSDTVCQTCNVSGTYQVTSAHFAAACIPWSLCPPGKFADPTVTPWVDQDRVCTMCGTDTFIAENNHTLDRCDEMTNCSTTAEATAGTVSSDRVCAAAAVAQGSGTSTTVTTTSVVTGVCLLALILLLLALRLTARRSQNNTPVDMVALQEELRTSLGLGAAMTFGPGSVGIHVKLDGRLDVLAGDADVDLVYMVETYMGKMIASLDGTPVLDQVMFDHVSENLLLVLKPSRSTVPLNGDAIVPVMNKVLSATPLDMSPKGYEGAGSAGALLTAVLARLALPQRVPREINHKHLLTYDVLGVGNFAEVYRATLDESAERDVPAFPVAAKVAPPPTCDIVQDTLARNTITGRITARL